MDRTVKRSRSCELRSNRQLLVHPYSGNDDPTAAHTQTGKGEGSPEEGADPRCGPSETGSCIYPLTES